MTPALSRRLGRALSVGNATPQQRRVVLSAAAGAEKFGDLPAPVRKLVAELEHPPPLPAAGSAAGAGPKGPAGSRAIERKFNPAQPRNPHSGEWIDTTPGDGGKVSKLLKNVVEGLDDIADGDDSSFAERVAHALNGQDALDATPAKLKRAPGGHHGHYEGEGLSGPKGMGSVRALSEYEGVEYQNVNGFLRRGPRKVGKKNPDDRYDPATMDEEWNLENAARVAEIDKTMAVSPLQDDVRVDRVIRNGSAVFGRDVWYGDILDFDTDDFDEFDRQVDEHWNQGERPDLTGLRWKDLGYSSTTADPAVAVDFGRRWLTTNSPLDGEPVLMTILVPKGTGGVQLAEMGHAAEILLERGLTFEVVADNGVRSDGYRHLDVRVVPG